MSCVPINLKMNINFNIHRQKLINPIILSIKTVIALLALLHIFALPAAQAGETLVLNTGFGAPLVNPAHNGVLDLVYQSLAERLGLTIQIQTLPAERALLNANSAVEDGDICRVAGLSSNYANLIQVPEAVFTVKSVVISKNEKFKVSGFNSLRPYRVGFLLGRKFIEDNLTGAKSVTKFATDQEAIAALEKDLIDVAILEKSAGMLLLKTHPGLKLLQPQLFQADCYLYLNVKHQKWAPIISAELSKMRKEGTLLRINKSLFNHYDY